MIFKQVKEIMTGQKTQTRRIWNEGDWTFICGYRELPNERDQPIYSEICSAKNRIRYQREKDYAVIPKRGAPALWIAPDDSLVYDWRKLAVERYRSDTSEMGMVELLKRDGYRPLRIKITELRRERVQSISEEDAIAEGIALETKTGVHVSGNAQRGKLDVRTTYRFTTSALPDRGFSSAVSAYQALWESINQKKGTRWADNPYVAVISFVVQ